MPDATENQFLGALLGMAIGDALGAPVSGMDRAEIAARLRKNAPSEFEQFPSFIARLLRAVGGTICALGRTP